MDVSVCAVSETCFNKPFATNGHPLMAFRRHATVLKFVKYVVVFIKLSSLTQHALSFVSPLFTLNFIYLNSTFSVKQIQRRMIDDVLRRLRVSVKQIQYCVDFSSAD
jgi:uncharacterized membrane protein